MSKRLPKLVLLTLFPQLSDWADEEVRVYCPDCGKTEMGTYHVVHTFIVITQDTQ